MRWHASHPARRGLWQVCWPFVLSAVLVLVLTAQCFALMSAGRAYVEGESQWSKAQKNALLELYRYIDTCEPRHMAAFHHQLRVPQGDRSARLALERDPPDLDVARQGFAQGGIHPGDIDGLIFVFRWLRWVEPIHLAVNDWRAADRLLADVEQVAEQLHQAVQRDCADIGRQARLSAQLHQLNAELTLRQTEFSQHLGEANRLLWRLALAALVLCTLALVLPGLWLSYRVVRAKVRAIAEAQAANRTQRDFLTAMSHDLRTPMNGVLGLLGVLQQGPLTAEQREASELMRNSGQALLGVLEDALDFSRIDDGTLTLDERPMDSGLVIEQVCAMLEPGAQDARVDLTHHVDPAVPAMVLGDPQRLRQIVQHLVGNAVKFSTPAAGDATGTGGTGTAPAARGRVHVRWAPAPGPAGEPGLGLSVIDNGIGIPPALIGRVFDAFVQADRSSTRRFGGAGLGLAITQALVQAMRGQVQVDSTPGQGSTFTVWLPLRSAVAADGADATGDPAGPGHHHPPGPRPVPGLALRCLVVAEPAGPATDLGRQLAFHGASVHQVATLAEALAWVAHAGQAPPQLCLLDDPGGPDGPGADAPASVAHHGAPLAALLAACAGTGATGEPGLRVLHLCRGRRRRLRAHPCLPGHTLDINGLTRARWLQVVQQVMTTAVRARNPAVAASPAAGPINEPTTEPAAAPAAPRAPAPSRPERILVAEDNPANQKVIAFQLRQLGFAAEIAADGSQALARWHSGRHDLLLTDLHMPVMDGFALSQALRAADARRDGGALLPIIALTANAQSGEAERCRAQGMDDFLTKPTSLPMLQATLERWLQASEAHRTTAPAPADAP
ncbi:ATP-binding protein [Ideonella sp. DXS22W]|uniref:histidine kinase n=1 Tax=Pseudaquabacterium inlustre TaxID=2984192 RepID=A0ABU9C9X9_9BURK